MSELTDLLARLWSDYAALNPQAAAIHQLLSSRGERIVNDHIALRTYADPRLGLSVLTDRFARLGYQPKDSYNFAEKKLTARHLEHPDERFPEIFISELRIGEFSPRLQSLVKKLIDQVPPQTLTRPDLPVLGRPWKVSWADYETLRAESEYAAWLAAFGFRANHFTVLVNALKTFSSLQELNDFLKQNSFKLNASGGEIKGSPAVYLEQSSTLADQTTVDFLDGPKPIPACYYEFARRYPGPDGKLYRGFVEKSADKIFESTNKR